MSGYPIKPQVSREPNGNINLYVGGAYKQLANEQAVVLFQQLAKALRTPYSEGVALFAANVLHAHRGDGPDTVSDVDGAELEELALTHGLLETFTRPTGGCGDGCLCDEGDRCLRYTPLAQLLIERIDIADEPAEVRL